MAIENEKREKKKTRLKTLQSVDDELKHMWLIIVGYFLWSSCYLLLLIVLILL